MRRRQSRAPGTHSRRAGGGGSELKRGQPGFPSQPISPCGCAAPPTPGPSDAKPPRRSAAVEILEPRCFVRPAAVACRGSGWGPTHPVSPGRELCGKLDADRKPGGQGGAASQGPAGSEAQFQSSPVEPQPAQRWRSVLKPHPSTQGPSQAAGALQLLGWESKSCQFICAHTHTRT